MAGGKIDILVEPDLSGFGSKLEGGLKGPLGRLGKMAAGFGAALGGAALAKDIVSVGMKMDTATNNLAAVTGATSDEIERMKSHAKELGKATDLTATSTSDALTAMLELSKGGFETQQAMDAAKGSLQLASAAQIEVGQAAEMTTQMINMFGLEASDAARVSDVLAGAANAAAGEIPDMALGLSQAGTVANMFGISMEETTTALAMFANAGVTGSDAGTSLKTMLTMLANPSKQAQQALDELGVAAYDASGEFVGLPELFDQIGDAQKRLSQEDFNRAAAAAFGTDAIRAAGIGAEAAGDAWDNLFNSITRSGQAAEMAEAQTNGLPGVAERLENTTDALKEEVYEKFQPLLVDMGNAAIDQLEAVEPKIGDLAGSAADFAGGLMDAFGTVRVIAGDVVGALTDVGSAAEPVFKTLGKFADGGKDGSFLTSPAALAGLGFMVSQFTDLGPAAERSSGKLRAFNDAVRLQRTLAKDAGEKVGFMAAAWGEVERQSPAWSRASEQFRQGSNQMKRWSVMAHTAAQDTDGFSSALRRGAGKAATFGDKVAGVGRAGGSLVRSGFGGLVNYLGGPWNLAIMGATLAIGALYQEHLRSEQEAQASRDRVRALKDTYDELTGSITNATEALIKQNLEESGAMAGARKLGIGENTMLAATRGNKDAAAEIEAASVRAVAAAIKADERLRKQFEHFGQDVTEYARAYVDGQGVITEEAAKKLSMNALTTDGQYVPDLVNEAIGDTRALVEGLARTTAETTEASKAAAETAFNNMQERVQNTSKLVDVIGERAAELKGTKLAIDITGDSEKEIQALRDELEGLGIQVGEPMNGKLTFDYSDVVDGFTLFEQKKVDFEKDIHGNLVINAGSLEEAQQQVDFFHMKVKELPDGRFAIDMDDEDTVKRLEELRMASEIDGVFTLADNIDEVKARNDELNGKSTTGSHTVSDNTDQVKANIDSNQNRNTSSTHTVNVIENVQRSMYGNLSSAHRKAIGINANGSYRTAADGYLSAQEAMIASGGQWLVWAEDETEGESFIPHAMSKRARSTEILLKTARLFGLNLVDGAGRPVRGRGLSTEQTSPTFFANGGLRSYTEGRKFTAGGQTIAVADLMEATREHVQAVATIADAEAGLADQREQFAREVEDVEQAEKRLEQARKSYADSGDGIADAEKALADARKNHAKAQKELAEKTADGESKEEDLEAARDKVSDAADSVAKAEKRLTEAHEGQSDASEAVTEAEKELAEARKVVASQSDRAAKAQRQYTAGYIAAAGQALEKVFEVVSGISGMVADRFSKVSDFFGAMSDVADSVAQLKQTVIELNMEQVRLRMNQMTAAADVRAAEINVARTRAEGIVSVAQAEKELRAVQARNYASNYASIDALFAAQIRYADSGLMTWDNLTDAAEGADAQTRAAIYNVALARANADMNNLMAIRDQELAAFDYETAVLNNQMAVNELSIYTDALREQGELLNGMTKQQATGAAAAMDGKAMKSQGVASIGTGVGKTVGGAGAGAAAGFMVAGPIGAAIGALIGGVVAGAASANDYRQGISDIKVGKHKEKTNKQELDEYLATLSPEERRAFQRDAKYVGGANVRTTLEAMQRRTDERIEKHNNDVKAKQAARERDRLDLEQDYRARVEALKSDVDFYGALKGVAESESEEEAGAYAEAARIAAENRDRAIKWQAEMRASNAESLTELRKLVDFAEAEAKRVGVKTQHVEFRLPPGESFTREQTLAMMQQLVAETDVRLTELENQNAPTGAVYFDR